MSKVLPGDWPIDPNIVDGTELAARLNRLEQQLSINDKWPAINFNTLTLNVAPAGVPNPTDPIKNGTGNGDPFNNLSSLFAWVANTVNVASLSINIAPGTYTEATGVQENGAAQSIVIHATGVDYTIAGIFRMATQAITFDRGIFKADHFNVLNNLQLQGATLEVPGGTQMSAVKCTGEFTVTADSTVRSGIARSLGAIQLTGGSVWCPGGVTLTVDSPGTDAITFTDSTYNLQGTVSTPGAAKDLVFMFGTGRPLTLVTTFTNGARIRYEMALVGNPGYVIDPGSRTITQYGTGNASGAAGPITVTFPIAFVGARSVTVTTQVPGNFVNLDNSNLASFRIDAGVNNMIWAYNWIAIGTL